MSRSPFDALLELERRAADRAADQWHDALRDRVTRHCWTCRCNETAGVTER